MRSEDRAYTKLGKLLMRLKYLKNLTWINLTNYCDYEKILNRSNVGIIVAYSKLGWKFGRSCCLYPRISCIQLNWTIPMTWDDRNWETCYCLVNKTTEHTKLKVLTSKCIRGNGNYTDHTVHSSYFDEFTCTKVDQSSSSGLLTSNEYYTTAPKFVNQHL